MAQPGLVSLSGLSSLPTLSCFVLRKAVLILDLCYPLTPLLFLSYLPLPSLVLCLSTECFWKARGRPPVPALFLSTCPALSFTVLESTAHCYFTGADPLASKPLSNLASQPPLYSTSPSLMK